MNPRGPEQSVQRARGGVCWEGLEERTWAVHAAHYQLAGLLVGGTVHANEVGAAIVKAGGQAEGGRQVVLPASTQTRQGRTQLRVPDPCTGYTSSSDVGHISLGKVAEHVREGLGCFQAAATMGKAGSGQADRVKMVLNGAGMA